MAAEADSCQPIASRPPPASSVGAWAWVKRSFFDGPVNTALTIVVLALLALSVPPLFSWMVLYATTAPDPDLCREIHAWGACWGVVTEKGRLILFGRYPFDEQWRPLVASAALVALLVASCLRPFWKPWLAPLWMAVLALFYVLMRGGMLGLTPVETSRWGGLPLTLILATVSIVVAFPLSVLVALGAGHPHDLHPVRGADPWRAADLGALHGQLHVSVVPATRDVARRAAARAGGHHAVFRRLPGRDRARRAAGGAQGTVRGGGLARPDLLAAAAQDRAAACSRTRPSSSSSAFSTF